MTEPNFYRPDQYTAVSTPSSVAGSALEGDNCIHCHAAWGHKIICPLLNRTIAEAKSATLNTPDAHFLKAQHITWEGDNR